MCLNKIVISVSLSFAFLLATPLQAADPPKVQRLGGSSSSGEKIIIGQAEYISIPALGDVFNARIDTGATTTSIYAVNVEEFERDGKRWARFVVKNPEKEKDYRLEMRVTRIAMIKKRGVEGETRRPSIKLDLIMGKLTKRLDVNLADRTGFEFPLLIGRDFLRGLAVVDVSLKYTQTAPDASAVRAVGER